MERVRLGRTGLQVSRVGLGGIPLQRPPENEAINTIRRCLDLGINSVDTSIAYGASEQRIGAAIEGSREEVVIATKSGWRGGREAASECLETSLAALRSGYVDLWQSHNVGTLEKYEALFQPGGVQPIDTNAAR